MVQKVTLAALVLVHNEERNLPDCLERLRFCDEIVVVLDRCSDRSKEIALSFGARIVEGAFPVEGERFGAGEAATQADWILQVDADERVSPALAAEVREIVATSAFDYHKIPFDNYVGERLVRRGWGAYMGTGSKSSLHRRGQKLWGRERVHPTIAWVAGARQGPTLRQHMTHYIDRDLSDMLRRLDRYTTNNALDLRDSGQIGSSFHAYRRLFSRFWKCYVRRGGYREGGLGFVIALCAGLYPLLSYLKARHDLADDGKPRNS